MLTPGTFEKSFNGSDKTKHVKKCGKKKSFFKPLFGALPKIGDWIQKYVQIHRPPWFLVLKNGLKKCSSLKK